ncbi:carbohydrate ABC transporter permease, partial [Streptomyces sp. C1-2]|nr:carbohydrate ABC transporter permease [Streptomyces sp. C1-2]
MTSTRTRTGTGTRNRTRTRPTPGRILAWALMTVALVATLFPFYWMVRTALTPAADLYSDSTGPLPQHP